MLVVEGARLNPISSLRGSVFKALSAYKSSRPVRNAALILCKKALDNNTAGVDHRGIVGGSSGFQTCHEAIQYRRVSGKGGGADAIRYGQAGALSFEEQPMNQRRRGGPPAGHAERSNKL